eukprot:13091_1
MASNEIFITLPVAITSAIVTIITSSIAIFVIHHFLFPESEKAVQTPSPSSAPVQLCIDQKVVSPIHSVPSQSPAPPLSSTNSVSSAYTTQTNSQRKPPITTTPKNKPRIKGIQLYSSCGVAVFNSLNTAFNTVYCVWLVVDPQDINEFYAYHPSFTHRIISTVCWYIAKVFFIWMLCSRLYHSFKGSIFHVNGRFVLFLGGIISIVAPIALVVAYWAVLVAHDQRVAEFAFNAWRLAYQIVVFIILFMFCNRLLRLVIGHEMDLVKMSRQTSKSVSKSEPSIQRQVSTRISLEFLEVITRHSVLVLTVSLTVLMTTLSWTGFRFWFGPHTCITLLVPMNMAAVDSLITSICIVCLFPVGKSVYATICRPPHVCFKGVCLFFAKRRLTVF